MKVSAVGQSDFATYLKMIFDFGEDQSMLSVLQNQDLRSVFFIKLISIFALISGNNYWIITAYFSLASFLASWYLFRTVENSFTNSSFAASVAFLFFPSVVFWGSGIEKETLALCGIYYLSAVIILMLKQQKIKWWDGIGIIVGAWLVWNLKYYWAAVFFISAFTAVIVWTLQRKISWMGKRLLLAWIIVFAGAGILASFSHPNFCLTTFLNVLVTNHDDFIKISGGKNLIHYYHLAPEWQSVLLNSPWALVSGIFRPFVGEGNGLLGLVASLENCVLLVLFLYAALSYIIVLCIFLALSTPNLGSLSRYRVGFLPFFVFLVTYKNPWLQNRFWSTRL
jgi:hypothetical protein